MSVRDLLHERTLITYENAGYNHGKLGNEEKGNRMPKCLTFAKEQNKLKIITREKKKIH